MRQRYNENPIETMMDIASAHRLSVTDADCQALVAWAQRADAMIEERVGRGMRPHEWRVTRGHASFPGGGGDMWLIGQVFEHDRA